MKSQHKSSAFTIDVEDGINILMRDHFNVNILPTDRVVKNTDRLLDLFEKYNVKTTLFVLGQVAFHYPELIRRMQREGHEIGVHSYDHIQFFKLSPKEARADITKAKQCIEDITGQAVNGFRAPAFSVIPSTAWALEVIAEAGFAYDSSIVPAQAGRYGWPNFSGKIQKLTLSNNSTIIEAPLSSVKILGKNIPACGGGYLRVFPYWFTSWALESVQKKMPAIVYMHPYEIDIERYPDYYYDAMNNAPLKKRLLLKSIRFNKETVFNKLERLLENYSFDRLDNVINHYIENNEIATTNIDNRN